MRICSICAKYTPEPQICFICCEKIKELFSKLQPSSSTTICDLCKLPTEQTYLIQNFEIKKKVCFSCYTSWIKVFDTLFTNFFTERKGK